MYTSFAKGYSLTDDAAKYYDRLIATIEEGAELADSKAIEELIKADRVSKRKEIACSANKYYDTENDILEKQFNRYTISVPAARAETGEIDDYYAKTVQSTGSNNKITSGFLADIIDTKISFALANDITWSSENDELLKLFLTYIKNDFMNKLIETATQSSKDGFASWHFFYPNEGDDLDYVEIPGIETILVYDKETQKKLEQVIFYYNLEYVDGDDITTATNVEIWSSAGRERWTKESGATDYTYTDFCSLLTKTDLTQSEGEEKIFDFGRPPFAVLKNNSGLLSDLSPIKEKIDDYDFNMSLTSNDIADLKQAFIFASGFSDDPDTFRKNLFLYKVAVSNNADSKITEVHVPLESEAREAHLNRLERNIYKDSRSIDFQSDAFTNDLSGEAINRLLIPLYLKVASYIRQLDTFIDQVVYFIVADINRKHNKSYKHDEIKWNFAPMKIINETDEINKIVTMLGSGVIDLEEAVGLLPLNINKEDLLKRLNDELDDLDDDTEKL
jgi:SPP1 family phage portal protein